MEEKKCTGYPSVDKPRLKYCGTKYKTTSEPEFVKLSARQLRRLRMDELVAYRKRERAALLLSPIPKRELAIRKALHPLLLAGLRVLHIAKGIRVKTNGAVPETGRPLIFAVSHIGLYDVEVVLQAIKKHVYLLSGDEEAMYRTFDGWCFEANGVIYVDPEDAEDRKIALPTTIKYLRAGQSIMWFPEGTWNLSPNYVILPIHFGIIEAAASTGAVIVPVGLEQYEEKHGNRFVVNIGKAFDPALHFSGELTKEKKIELAEMLRGAMARLKLDAWEAYDRADIKAGYWDAFIAKRFAEWPYYSMDVIQRRLFNPNRYISPEEAFAHLKQLRPCRENAFLFRER